MRTNCTERGVPDCPWAHYTPVAVPAAPSKLPVELSADSPSDKPTRRVVELLHELLPEPLTAPAGLAGRKRDQRPASQDWAPTATSCRWRRSCSAVPCRPSSLIRWYSL